MIKFLLIGASFSNKGAEAMAAAAIAELHVRYTDCRITVASYSSTDTLPPGLHALAFTGQNGQPLDFELIKNPGIRQKMICIIASCASVFFPPFRKIFKKSEQMQLYLSRLQDADIVLDLSGFALSDQRLLRRRLLYCLEILFSRYLKKPFVIFTQALGPFHLLTSRLLARWTLPHVQLLLARGQITFQHLQALGLEGKIPIHICTDVAYLLPSSSQAFADTILGSPPLPSRPYFGIIPNIRAFQQGSSADASNSYLSLLIDLCDYVQTAWQCRVVLICHELSLERQNDQWLIEQIMHQAHSPENIRVVSGEHSASDLKAVIGRLDFVVISRFHAVVGAIGMATPFVVIGWAHKYHELLADIHMEDVLFDVRHLEREKFFNIVRMQWEKRAETKTFLAQHSARLSRSASRAFEHLASILPPDSAHNFNDDTNDASSRTF